MTRTATIILGVCGAFVSWTVLSVLLLLNGNDWWLSGLTTLTVFVWLAGLLVVIFQQGRLRAAATGAVIASVAYWLMALGPWFSTHVGPTLLTSRLLARADLLLHGNAPQSQTLAWASPSPIYSTGNPTPVGGSGAFSGQIAFTPQVATIVTMPPSAAGSVFQSLGHWLFIWLTAAIGGCAAFFMTMRTQRKPQRAQTAPPSATIGESPFGPTAPSAPSKVQAATAGEET